MVEKNWIPRPDVPGVYQVRFYAKGKWYYPIPPELPIFAFVKPFGELGQWINEDNNAGPTFQQVDDTLAMIKATLKGKYGPLADTIEKYEFAKIGEPPTEGKFADGGFGKK